MAYTDHFETVQKLYIGYYQRPADPGGLFYWSQFIDANGGNATSVVNGFAASEEAKALYGTIDGTTIASVVRAIYQALFNRTVTESDEGVQFYVGEFNAGTYGAGDIVLAILNGASNVDKITLDNKVYVANLFTEVVDGRSLTASDFGNGTVFNVTYDKDDAKAAREILAEVTDLPTTRLNKAGVTQKIIEKGIANDGDTIGGGSSSGNSVALVKGPDNIVGTSGDDLFTASVSAGDKTLESGDKINGGGGTDTLLIESDGSRAISIPTGVTISNVEILHGIIETNAVGFNLSKLGTAAASVEKVIAEGGNGDVKITGSANLKTVDFVEFNSTTGKNATLEGKNISTINLTDIDVGSDSYKITLQDVESEKFAVNLNAVTGGSATKGILLHKIGKNNIKDISFNFNDIDSKEFFISTFDLSSLETLTLNGKDESIVQLNNLSSDITLIDASEFSGGVSYSSDASKQNTEVKGGSGDNTITLGGRYAGKKITTGNGKDVITLGERANDVTVNAKDGDNAVTFGDDAENITITGGKNQDDITFLGSAQNITIKAGDGKNTVKFEGTGSVAEKIDITGGAGVDAIIFSGKATGVDISTGAGNDEIAFSGDVTKTDINTGAGDDKVEFSGDVTKTDINTGAGNDTIKFSGDVTSVDINTGAGNDEITFSGAVTKTNIHTGAGDDKVVFSANVTVGAGDVKIYAGAGKDTIDLSAGGAAYGSNGSYIDVSGLAKSDVVKFDSSITSFSNDIVTVAAGTTLSSALYNNEFMKEKAHLLKIGNNDYYLIGAKTGSNDATAFHESDHVIKLSGGSYAVTDFGISAGTITLA